MANGLGQIIPQLFTPGPMAAAVFFGQGADQVTERSAKDDAPQWKKDLNTLGGGTASAVLNKIGLDGILKASPLLSLKSPLLARASAIGVATGTEALTEGAENVAHDALRQQLTNPNASIDWGDAGQAAGVGGTVAAIVRTAIESALHIKGRHQKQFFDDLVQASTESEIAKHSPEAMADFVNQSAEGSGAENVFIPADKFTQYFQSVEADPAEAAKAMGATNYDEAKAAGTDVVIPMGEFAARVAPSEHMAGLFPDLRLHQGDMTQRELEEYQANKEARDQYLTQQYEQLVAEGEKSHGINTAIDRVVSDTEGQLLSSGVEPSTAKTQATVMRGVAVLAHRAFPDMNPVEAAEKLWNTYGLQIKRDLPPILTQLKNADVQLAPLLEKLRAGAIPKEQEAFGQPLHEFIRSMGGVQDQGGELSSRDADVGNAPFVKNLIQALGMDFDGARELAAQHGFPVGETEADFISALTGSLEGSPVYSPNQENSNTIEEMQTLEALDKALKDSGIDLNAVDNQTARQMLEKTGEVQGARFEQGVESGPFGPVLTGFRHDAQGAISKLIELQTGDAVAALHHPDVGDIDLVWGKTSDNPKDKGYGLAKLLRWHPESVVDLQDFIESLPKIDEKSGENRTILENDQGRAVISLNWLGGEKVWLLTAFEKKQAGDGTTIDTADIAGADDTASRATSPEQSIDDAIKTFYQSAYHGSPFKFDKFSLEHMGRGEGAQAYGWGLYFAKNKDIAEWYRDNLSSRKGADPSNVKFSGKTPMAWYQYWPDKADKAKDPTEFYDRMSMLENLELTWNAKATINTAQDEELSPIAIKWFEDTIAKNFERPGATYEVDIPEDSEMLDWDKPLSEQPPSVREALSEIGIPDKSMDGREIYAYIRNKMADESGRSGASPAFYKSFGEQASKYLNGIGIKGIKFLDANSRDGSQAEGSHNYVVFDDNAIRILQTYYQQQDKKRGYLQIGPNRQMKIGLTENANLSTFLHETGHFYLEMMGDLAAMPDSAQEVKDDYAKILKWMGIADRGQIETRHHEMFAEAIEAYLKEGKAPALELQGAFQRIKAWMSHVYEGVKKRLDVELSDEVRGVFDRIYATDQEIAAAKDAVDVNPLFQKYAASFDKSSKRECIGKAGADSQVFAGAHSQV